MSDARWYIVHAYSNFEQKVAEAIMREAKVKKMAHLFDEVLVPSHDVTEVRRGKKINVKKRNFPGYVLVKMHMTDPAYHLVTQLPKVTGFLGQDKKPMPITEREVDRLTGSKSQEEIDPQILSDMVFEIGEKVRVLEGPFQSFEGEVEEVDSQAAKLKLNVSIFGRATPVELDYNQVEKLD